jgi:hypothetical protein
MSIVKIGKLCRSMDHERLTRSFSSGLSGCKLSISNDGKFVTKISSDHNYNLRLSEQIKKQIEFKKISVEGIMSPGIVESGKNEDGLYYFTMEYAAGKDYMDFLNYSSPEEIRIFTNSIFRYIESIRFNSKSKYTDSEFSDICIGKMRSIKKHIPDHFFYEFLEDKIKKISGTNVELSFCHGDLTLSNILFSKKTIFFLDFLDSYIESWIIDLVKLKQDLFYFWSSLRSSDKPNLRFIQSSINIWYEIEKKYSEVVFSDEFMILEALNFLRIYPYAKEESDILLIETILKKLPIYEEFNNSNGG